MKKKYLIVYCSCIFLAYGCIGDDIIDDRVDEKVRITSTIDTLAISEEYQFEASFFNEVGELEQRTLIWGSSNEQVLSMTQQGLATGVQEGSSIIMVEVTLDNGDVVADQTEIEVNEKGDVEDNPGARQGAIRSTSSYELSGDYSIEQTSEGVLLTLEDNFKATSALPGLYVYLGNNNSSIGSALEISKVVQFEGKHTYSIPGVGVNDYEFLLFWCKPFNVKVGEGTFNN